MAQSCFLLGFIVLTLVSTISSYPMSRDITTPSWASTIAPVVEAKLQRHHVIAAVPPKSTQASPVSTSTSYNRTIHCHNLTTCPRQTSFSLQQQSQWSPGDISNIVFGCVAAILGALTLGVTYFLHVQRSQAHQLAAQNDAFSSAGDAVPLQDLPPSYSTIHGSLRGLDRDGA